MTQTEHDPILTSEQLAAPSTNAGRAVLLEVLMNGNLSRAELAQRVGLSRPSLSRITRSLVETGFIVEAERLKKSTTGRPFEMLRVNPHIRHFMGVKLTHDHLYAVATDLQAEILAMTERSLSRLNVPYVVEQIRSVMDELSAEVPDISAVGISLPGRIVDATPGSIVVDSALFDWLHVDLGAAVSVHSTVPVAIADDVHALTAAEHWFGSGVGLDSLAVITVGEAVRVGVVVDGEILVGAHGSAGRLSHTIVDPNGPLCHVGHHGCVASYLRNDGIIAMARAGSEDMTYRQAVSRAKRGDERALSAFHQAGYALGVLIATVCNAIDPQRVLLTGDGIDIYPIAGQSITHGIADRAMEPDQVDLDVRSFAFEEWARGAAAYAIRKVWFGPVARQSHLA